MSTIAILGSPDLAFNVNDPNLAPSYRPKANQSSDRGSMNLPQPWYRVSTPIGLPTPPQPTHTRVPIHWFANPRHSGRQPKNHQPAVRPRTCEPHFRFVESVMFANHALSPSLPRTVGHRPCLVVKLHLAHGRRTLPSSDRRAYQVRRV